MLAHALWSESHQRMIQIISWFAEMSQPRVTLKDGHGETRHLPFFVARPSLLDVLALLGCIQRLGKWLVRVPWMENVSLISPQKKSGDWNERCLYATVSLFFWATKSDRGKTQGCVIYFGHGIRSGYEKYLCWGLPFVVIIWAVQSGLRG